MRVPPYQRPQPQTLQERLDRIDEEIQSLEAAMRSFANRPFSANTLAGTRAVLRSTKDERAQLIQQIMAEKSSKET